MISDCCFLSVPKTGRRLVWEVTQYCPYSCEYCFTWSSPKRQKSECNIFAVGIKIQSLISQLKIDDVLITGGEPLAVTENIVPLLKFLKNNSISFSLSSTLYSKNTFNEVAQYRPRTVNLSVDPPNGNGAKVNFKSKFDAIDNKLAMIKNHSLNAKLTSVISKPNLNGVKRLLDYYDNAIKLHGNISKIAFNRQYPVGYAADSVPYTQKDLAPVYNFISEWAKTTSVPISLVNWSEFHAPLQGCPAGTHIISIQQNGDVTPCSLLYNISRSFSAGNILSDPLDVIINRLNIFGNDLEKYYKQTEINTCACLDCRLKAKCGGGCYAMLPIASNHIPKRTCELNPIRVNDHERALISNFHHQYHQVYTPSKKGFTAPKENLSSGIEKSIRDYVVKKLNPSDLAHTMEHIDCVVKMAKLISDEEGASQKITVPAAYFHDIAPRETGMHHMHTYKSAAMAGKYLPRLKCFTLDEIVHIQYCIITSSYGSYLLGYQPLSLEAKVVRDADWLDAIGARGIARVFAFNQAHGAKEMGHMLEDPEGLPIQIDMNITGPDENPITHFFTKLLKINSLLATSAGKKLGERRHKFMVQFLKQYQEDIELGLPASKQLRLKPVDSK